MDLKAYIRDIPDFPAAGILFRDITPLLSEPRAFDYAIDALSEVIRCHKPSAIVAIESRGFILGAPVSQRLSLPFVPIRKPGKLPFEVHSIDYSLEYGKGRLEMHRDALNPGQRVAIIDDLLATGGTAHAARQLTEQCQAEVCAFAFLVELRALKGHERLKQSAVHALVSY